jgi:hypothetical protein
MPESREVVVPKNNENAATSEENETPNFFLSLNFAGRVA